MKVTFRGKTLEIDPSTSIKALQELIETEWSIPPENQKLLGGGKQLPLGSDASIEDAMGGKVAKIMVLGTPQADVEKVQSAGKELHRQGLRRVHALATLDTRKAMPAASRVSSPYTFDKLESLPYGDSEAALQYLQRLKDDKSIQKLMDKYKLKVGLLAELDPTLNTDEAKRRLGVNENFGQVIRLRIRTDDYEGFCDYNSIRMVLCHELAHNTHGEHDDAFWRVCKLYESEVKQGWGVGHRLGGEYID